MSTPDPLASLPKEFFSAPDVPAVSVALQTNGGSWTRTSSGITPNTLFQAASISKAVAALAALALVDKHVVDLEGDVNDYLETWKLPVSPRWPTTVKVKHLLCHGGALSVRSFPGYPQGTPLPSLTDILDGRGNCLTTCVRVSGMPGLIPEYSGGGYTVLQLLIQDVTRKPFADAVTELILKPLGMAGARYGPPGTAPFAPGWLAANPPVRAKARAVTGGWLVYPELAAAGLWCTPTDLVTFGRAIQAMAAQPDAGPVVYPLRKALAQKMLTDALPGWGLGVELEYVGSVRAFGHGGDNEGYACQLTGTIAPGPVIAIMTSSNVGKKVIGPLLEHIRKSALWPGVPALSPVITFPAVTQMPTEDELALLPHLYGGNYTISGGASRGRVIKLAGHGWNWTVTLPGQPPLPLEPKSATKSACPGLPIDIKFEQDATGRATKLTLSQTDEHGATETIDADRV